MRRGRLGERVAPAPHHRQAAIGRQAEQLRQIGPHRVSLEPVLLALCEWGQRHATALNELDRVADCVIRPRKERKTTAGAEPEPTTQPL